MAEPTLESLAARIEKLERELGVGEAAQPAAVSRSDCGAGTDHDTAHVVEAAADEARRDA